MVTIVSGANESVADLAGTTVGQARQAFRAAFNIADGAVATLNGAPVEEGRTLSANDRLVFAQPLAEKGC